jgi:hypothetical protein
MSKTSKAAKNTEKTDAMKALRAQQTPLSIVTNTAAANDAPTPYGASAEDYYEEAAHTITARAILDVANGAPVPAAADLLAAAQVQAEAEHDAAHAKLGAKKKGKADPFAAVQAAADAEAALDPSGTAAAFDAATAEPLAGWGDDDTASEQPADGTGTETGGVDETSVSPGILAQRRYVAKMKAAGIVGARLHYLAGMGLGCSRLILELQAWSTDQVHGAAFAAAALQVLDAHTALANAYEQITAAQVTAAWTPPKKAAAAKTAKAKTEIAVGDTVMLREKVRADYDGVVEAADFTGLTVLAITKTVVRCKTPTHGETITLPRAHVVTA